jgi:hypothetical protein
MPTAQTKKVKYDGYNGITDIQNVLREYLETEKDKTALYRLCIVNYELGALMQKLVYRRAYPKSAKCGSIDDLRLDIGDAMVNLMLVAEIMGISSAESMYEAMERLENKEWRKHG